MAVFVTLFGKKLIFGQFHETVIWYSPRPPVSIFPGQTDSFNILYQYHGFMKLLKNSTFCQKLVTKLAIFICQFKVKLWDNKIKKWTRFFVGTGLLENLDAKYLQLQCWFAILNINIKVIYYQKLENIGLFHVQFDETACHRAMKKKHDNKAWFDYVQKTPFSGFKTVKLLSP